MGGACGTHEGKGNAYIALVGKLKKEPLGRQRRGW